MSLIQVALNNGKWPRPALYSTFGAAPPPMLDTVAPQTPKASSIRIRECFGVAVPEESGLRRLQWQVVANVEVLVPGRAILGVRRKKFPVQVSLCVFSPTMRSPLST